MQFLLGLLPGLFIGIALGLTGSIIGRHARPVTKGLVKAGIVLGGALGKVFAASRRRFDALVVEARAELAGRERGEPDLAAGPWGEHDIGRGVTGSRDEPFR